MTVVEVARIYTDLVNLDERIPESERFAKDEISILRSKYHQILMDKFQEEGIEFMDRFDAMRKAFEIVKNDTQLNVVSPHSGLKRKTGT